MNAWRAVALLDGAVGVLMAVEWWWLLGRHNPGVGPRSRASLVGFGMATVALLLQLLLAAAALRYGSLDALDQVSRQGGTSAFVAVLVLCSLVTAGILSLAAVIVTLLGKGLGRMSTTACSAAVALLFVATLILAVNSFH